MSAKLVSHAVWDPVVRWFHWINYTCVLALIAVGVMLLNDDALALGNVAKLKLKTVHVVVGYVFTLNLAVRLWWAFVGRRVARWRAILPFGRRYRAELRRYVANLRSGRVHTYLGHNPLGRISITLLFLLLVAQAVTGLVLAGTDLFYPPFGSWIAGAVAAPGVDAGTLVPYAPSTYDAQAFAAMRAWRRPFAEFHENSFYVLIGMAVMHIAAVVMTDLRGHGALISAMFSGRKIVDVRQAQTRPEKPAAAPADSARPQP
jgi:cytochrome b